MCFLDLKKAFSEYVYHVGCALTVSGTLLHAIWFLTKLTVWLTISDCQTTKINARYSGRTQQV